MRPCGKMQTHSCQVSKREDTYSLDLVKLSLLMDLTSFSTRKNQFLILKSDLSNNEIKALNMVSFLSVGY
jgi:hypothetical protein